MTTKAPQQRPESWPVWYDGKHVNEVLFCHDFLTRHPMRCVNGTLFTVDGPVINEELVKHQIVKAIQTASPQVCPSGLQACWRPSRSKPTPSLSLWSMTASTARTGWQSATIRRLPAPSAG